MATHTHILVLDKHNHSKGHHISFCGSKIFYNQAIHNINQQHNPRSINKAEVPGYEDWYDFYEKEPVEFRGDHGYQEYIDRAFFKHNNIVRKQAKLDEYDRQRLKADNADFKNMVDMNHTVSYFCQHAKREASKEWAVTQFRGASLVFIDVNGNRTNDDPVWYNGRLTKKLIDEMVTAVGDKLQEIWYDNGVDGADSVFDMREGVYYPLVASVDVCVYRKDK